MKVSLNWLQSYVDLTGVSAEDISRAITFLGFEVEQVIRTGAPAFNNVVVGHILTRDKHPNADKLSVCTVDVGALEKQVGMRMAAEASWRLHEGYVVSTAAAWSDQRDGVVTPTGAACRGAAAGPAAAESKSGDRGDA